ncbi:Transposase [Shigella dysenteriae 1617]|uniref:Transposase n=2 Tax=Shigella dysenteriae TaxID=622 RepID=A0A0A7A1V9_SHIDY|nr:Transposase [Shigella dysenteriae 1617]
MYPGAVITTGYSMNPQRSGYYDRVQHAPSDRKQSDERLKLEIKVAHIRTRETYGTRRLQTELEDNGIIVGRDRLARLRKELRLHCKQKRKFRATTNSDHNLPVTPNLLNQNFTPTAPNQVWVADITYVATREGWLYLAGVKDVYTCEIVGYAMGERMTKELTGKALFMALRSQRPPAGLIHHTDRGSQYCAYDYRVIQEQSGLKTSMSRKGNCYDNAPMESFWGTLKNESLSHYRFKSRDEAISVIREYIEIFYNRLQGKISSDGCLKKEQMVVSAIASTPQATSLEELKKMQRDNLKDQYNEEIFQFHDCNAKHFTCKYQDVLINFDGQQKRTISVYLEDTPRAVGIIALMEPDTADKYRQQAMEIMLSAKNTVK